MAVIKYSLETLLQDDRITDEEWIALGKALELKFIKNENNILDKSKDELYLFVHNLLISSFEITKLLYKFSLNNFNYCSVPFIIIVYKCFELISFYLNKDEKIFEDTDILEKEQEFFNLVTNAKTDDKKTTNNLEDLVDKGKSMGILIDASISADISKGSYDWLDLIIQFIGSFAINKFSIIVPTILIIGVIRKRLYISDIFKEIDDGTVNNNI